MQIKFRMRYYYINSQNATAKNSDRMNASEDVGKRDFHPLLVQLQNSTTLENVLQYLLKLNKRIPCDPVIPSLGIYATSTHTCIYQKTCTGMSVTLFVTSKH